MGIGLRGRGVEKSTGSAYAYEGGLNLEVKRSDESSKEEVKAATVPLPGLCHILVHQFLPTVCRSGRGIGELASACRACLPDLGSSAGLLLDPGRVAMKHWESLFALSIIVGMCPVFRLNITPHPK